MIIEYAEPPKPSPFLAFYWGLVYGDMPHAFTIRKYTHYTALMFCDSSELCFHFAFQSITFYAVNDQDGVIIRL